jgi:hypothetical protein
MEKLLCEIAASGLLQANAFGSAVGQDCVAARECCGYELSADGRGLNGIEVEVIEGVVKVRRE